MKNNDYLKTIDGMFAPLTPKTFSRIGSAPLIPRQTGEILRKTSAAITHENSRALLAYTALENTMMLSALEAVCYRTAPFGEQRYAQIVNAYAAGAARRIALW